jgi:hypothetical protein
MSATLDPKIFQKYYKEVGRYIDSIDIQKYSIPVVNCEAGNKEVEVFYLDQIKTMLDSEDNQVNEIKLNKKNKI